MPPPYRILHVVASLQGGAAQHVLHLARAFQERGHVAAVSAPRDNPAFEDRLRGLAIPFYDTPLNSSFPLEAIFVLRALFESDSWTHIHVHGHRAALIARLASVLTRHTASVIYTVHGYHPPYYANPVSQFLVNGGERILYPCTDFYICVSHSTRDDLSAAIPLPIDRCAVVENAVPLAVVSESERQQLRTSVRQRYAIPPDAFVVGTVGRLHWQKAVSRLIRAFRVVRNTRDNVYLLIVGDGPLRHQMETLADSLQITGRCRFTGHRENPTEFYSAMDLFVLSSLWEGLPLTILEAWAAGVPVAATNVPGSRDMVENEVTGLVATNSLWGIAEAIERILTQPEIAPTLVQNAQTVLKERFSMNRMIDHTEQVYRQTLRSF